MKFTFVSVLSYVAFIPLYATIGLFLYWTYESYIPVVIDQAYFPSKIAVPTGESFNLHYAARYTRDCAVLQIGRYLVQKDPSGSNMLHYYAIGTFDTNTKKTLGPELEIVNREIFIPSTLKPGTYQYRIRRTRQCNIYDYIFPITIEVIGPTIEVLPKLHG